MFSVCFELHRENVKFHTVCGQKKKNMSDMHVRKENMPVLLLHAQNTATMCSNAEGLLTSIFVNVRALGERQAHAA